MTNKLRLLIDESITEPLAGNILKLVPSAVLSKECVGQGAPDAGVAAYANRERRLIVSVDSDFDKLNVTYGVIRIRTYRADDECLFEIFKAFWISGHRSKSKASLTLLSPIRMKVTNKLRFEHRWSPSPCPNHSED